MKLIVGLGNPGLQYAATRHNIGFEAIDALAEIHHISVTKNKYKALFGEGRIGNERVVLVKPQTYMNLSGEAIVPLMSWYKIQIEDIIIIYDDVSLSPGQIRIRMKGSAGGHNGIKDIIQKLGTDEFARIKIGVGEKPAGWDLANYVLGKFSQEEIKTLQKTMKVVTDATQVMITDDVQAAMNMYNSKARG